MGIWQLVALRKESVDRNYKAIKTYDDSGKSLSARRAWIEIDGRRHDCRAGSVALRKESVDRNSSRARNQKAAGRVALRKESVDRNCCTRLL